jgi:multidrug efflux pump
VASNVQEPLSRASTGWRHYGLRLAILNAHLAGSGQTHQRTDDGKDVTDAIKSQNAQIAVGQLGGTPSVDNQSLNAPLTPNRCCKRRSSSAILRCALIRTVRW